MREIEISGGSVSIVDDEWFSKLSIFKWYLSTNGYAMRSTLVNGKRKTIRMHREIVGAEDGEIVDHANGNRLDNRSENLRICTFSQNIANSKKYSNNTSGLKGVYIQNGKWKAQIYYNWKNIHLGYFDTKEQAYEAYKAKAKEFFGEYARFE